MQCKMICRQGACAKIQHINDCVQLLTLQCASITNSVMYVHYISVSTITWSCRHNFKILFFCTVLPLIAVLEKKLMLVG